MATRNHQDPGALPETTVNPAGAVRVPRAMQVIKVRLSGEPSGIDRALSLLAAAAGSAGVRVEGQTSPYPNRREPGARVYLALRFPARLTQEDGAAHRRQAISRPAATQSKEA